MPTFFPEYCGSFVDLGKVDIIESNINANTGKRIKHLVSIEIDFVAEGDKDTVYYQVSESVRDPNVLARELRPLKAVKDYNQRFFTYYGQYPTHLA
ncbi:MAG: hypothetical protein LBF23_00070 [Endomicrobium sp.]|jgi:hypothetical protein|nr:hypothetical protein [Endomicrobium sp.]